MSNIVIEFREVKYPGKRIKAEFISVPRGKTYKASFKTSGGSVTVLVDALHPSTVYIKRTLLKVGRAR